MSNVGIAILLITLLSIIFILIFNKFLKNIFRSYAFYFGFSVLYLSFFIIFRYVDSVQNLMALDWEKTRIEHPYTYSFTLSKVFLLDLCPIISFLLPLSLIFDKSRCIAKVISPFGILGGFVTIFGGMIFTKEINVPIWQFLLLGESPNYLMFSSHYLVLIISIILIMNSSCYTKWSILGVALFFGSYVGYVLIISGAYGIECNTTGLRSGDWYNPYPDKFWYSQYGNLYNLVPLGFELSILFWYVIATIIGSSVMFLKNSLNKDERNAPQIWFRYCKRISPFLYKIDTGINSLSSKIEFSFKSKKTEI